MRTLSSSCFAALAFGCALAVEAFPLQPTYDFTFDGDGKTSDASEREAEYKEGLVGRDNDFLNNSFIDSALGKGFRLWAASFGSGSEFRNDPFTIAAYVKAPTEPKKVIWGAGHTKEDVAIFLTTGETESEIQLCVYKKDTVGTVVLATATVPDACLRPHLYTVIVDKLNTESFGFYVDGAECKTAAIHCDDFQLWRNNLQIGFVDGDYPPGYGRPSDDGSYMDELMIFDGTALDAEQVVSLAEEFPYDPSAPVTLPRPTYDFTFDGDGKTSTNSERTAEYKEGLVGRDSDFLDKSFIDSALSKGFRLWAGSYGSGSEFRNDPFTIAAYVKAPTEPKKVIWGAGHTTEDVAIFLATGETESDIQLCVYKKDTVGTVVLATATVPDACLRPHLYTVIANKLNTESFGFYVDGAECKTAAIHCDEFHLWRNNLQIGFVDGDYPPGYGRPSDDGSYMDELMIFDGTALIPAFVAALAEKFPYDPSAPVILPRPTYDFTFDGDGKTSDASEREAEYKEGLVGRDNDFLNNSFIDSALGKGFRLWAASFGSGSEFRNDPFTIAAYVKAPTEPKKVIWGAGHTKENVAIFLATGETESEIQLCVYKQDAPGLVVLATATVPDACLRPHLYTVIANKLNTESFGFYVDGAKCETAAIHCEGFKLERNNLQIGFVDGDYPPGYGRPSDDGSYMDELMIFDGTALNAALVSVLAEKFPHEVRRGLLILVR